VSLDPATRDVLLVVTVAVAVLALVVAVVALVAMRRMRRELVLLQADGDAPTFVEAVGRQTEQVRSLRGEVDDLSALLARTRTELADSIRHVNSATTRSRDMGGRLSSRRPCSTTAATGSSSPPSTGGRVRSYIKGVKSGTSDATLSPEEQQAVTFAMRGASS
jgi:hypothetical protein